MKKVKNNQGGFNLIELLVVMAIIAVLVGILIYTINAARMQQRNTQRRGIVNTAKASLEAYYAKYKDYPAGTQNVTTLLSNNAPAGIQNFATGIDAASREDPSGAANRNCYSRISRSQYRLYTVTEPTAAPGACAAGLPAGAEDFSVL